jgi:hypothetical protein
MTIFTRALTLVGLVSLLTACATAPSRPMRTEFEDIPVPKGLTYLEDQSTIIESPHLKAARLVYRGRLEPVSLGLALRTTLEANGWRHLSSATSIDNTASQVFEKSGQSLQVRLWEGLWFTYVEVTAGRVVTPGSARLMDGATTPGPVR